MSHLTDGLNEMERRWTVANNSLIRLPFYGLLAALSLPALHAQETPQPLVSTSGDVTEPSLTSPLATPAELPPPNAPKVTCDGGQLAVSADNSTLRSVLAAIHACIGVQIDLPEGSDGGRTFEELGPGPIRQVLVSLLSGTDFNYVIGSSDTNPEKVETVLLMRRTKADGQSPSSTDYAQTPARRTWAQIRQKNRPSTAPIDNDYPATEETPSVTDTESPSTLPAKGSGTNATDVPSTNPPAIPSATGATEPLVSPTGAPALPASTTDTPASADSGKNTEDRIADMQKLFEERRKMAQSQSSTSSQQ
jgi:hypothetical protein